jgi:hypothetical protein
VGLSGLELEKVCHDDSPILSLPLVRLLATIRLQTSPVENGTLCPKRNIGQNVPSSTQVVVKRAISTKITISRKTLFVKGKWGSFEPKSSEINWLIWDRNA